MVATYINGRLGNQLFQYAFSKAVKLAQGDNAPLVFNFDLVHKAGKPEDGFEDALKYFNVESYKTDGTLWLKHGSLKQIFLYLLYRIDTILGFKFKSLDSWYILFRKNGMVYVRISGGFSQINYPVYQKCLKTGRPKRIICRGIFEVPALFEHIKPILMEEFTPKQPPRPQNRALYDIIHSTNSICVSIRRGDYLSDRYRSRFLVCDQSYFDRALEKAKELVENPVFIFFSDDIEWVKENIKIDAPAYYESGNNPVWEILRLMYSCKHFIISNSTFSWWAQYLSRNTGNKIVISPDHWFNNSPDAPPSPLIADDFIKIQGAYQ